jgi:glyoxylase-like metal-dependent hydrolase (beta-lactamase superfamily II)
VEGGITPRAITERDLADLGIHRISIPIPFLEAGGPVNAYAIEDPDGALLLFDSGLGSPEAEAAMEAGLRRLGRSPADVRRIVVSHGHIDHYGGARTLLEKAGHEITVEAHPRDIPKMAEGFPAWREQMHIYGAFFWKLGVPMEAMVAASSQVENGFARARRIPRVTPLDLSAPLRMRWVTLEPMHMPGHTPGLLCLYDREHRIFLSDDHLLEHVSPNPLIELGPDGEEGWRPLLAYVESVARLRALEVDLVLPGHAEPFADHRKVIDALLDFYRKRQERIRDELAAGPLSGWDVTRRLFPRAPDKALFLTLSEALANLEVLEASGEVTRELDGDRYRFRRN